MSDLEASTDIDDTVEGADTPAPAGDFGLETDLQVQDASEALAQIEALRPEAWSQLDEGERLTALQNTEDQMAAIQERPSVWLVPEAMGPGQYGAFDGSVIHVNADQIAGDMPVEELVDTVVHEGRHAYQAHLVAHPELAADPEVVRAWASNMEPENYLDAETYGQDLYQSQPVEADAWQYAARVVDGLRQRTGA